eukprot:2690175-Prymnesium_polylepis.1
MRVSCCRPDQNSNTKERCIQDFAGCNRTAPNVQPFVGWSTNREGAMHLGTQHLQKPVKRAPRFRACTAAAECRFDPKQA